MRIKRFAPPVGCLVAFALASTSAQALTVNSFQVNFQPVPGVGNTVPVGYPVSNTLAGELRAGANGNLNAKVGIDQQARSPWTTLTSPSTQPLYDREFQWVNNGTITCNLDGQIPSGKALAGTLLWGSPDDYNTLTVSNSHTGQTWEIVPGSAFRPPKDGTNTYLVAFSGIVFDRVVVGSTSPSFELANLSVTAVPIPAAAILFLSGLLGVFALGWRRKGLPTGPQRLAG